MKSAKQLVMLQWSGDVYARKPCDEDRMDHTVDQSVIAAVWGFKIFESIGACATHAEESDMLKYRALASVLGAGRIRDNVQTQFWFEGRELAVLYAALCNVQTNFLNASRMNLEKTLMRNALEQRDPEGAVNALRCAIKSQASMMTAHTGVLMDFAYRSLDDNHRVLLSVE